MDIEIHKCHQGIYDLDVKTIEPQKWLTVVRTTEYNMIFKHSALCLALYVHSFILSSPELSEIGIIIIIIPILQKQKLNHQG